MKNFVLIKRGQIPVTAAEAAESVADHGFSKAAQTLGVSTSTLRKFMQEEGYRFKRNTSWQVEHLPGLESDADETTATGATDPESTGTAGGEGSLEGAGV